MHFDNLLFVLLGLALVLLRWLVQRATDSKKQPPREEQRPPQRPTPVSEEERVRRFMEALGNPVGSKPPPKVAPRPMTTTRTASAETKPRQPARKTVWANPLPPLTTAPPPASAPKRVTLPQLIKKPPVETKTFRPITPASAFDVLEQAALPAQPAIITTPAAAYASATQRPTRTATAPLDVRALLSSPDGLRNAIILREIFGPPRAWQGPERFYV